MKRYQHGEYRAFEVLYERYSPRLYGYLRTKCSNPGEAEDLLQQTFLNVHRNRYRYDSTLPFVPWIFSIARNILIDHLRKRRAVPTEDGKLISLADRASERFAESPSMEEILNLLPPEQRRLLELRFSEGMSFEEIAGKHGITAVSARKRVSRAIEYLRKLTGSKS